MTSGSNTSRPITFPAGTLPMGAFPTSTPPMSTSRQHGLRPAVSILRTGCPQGKFLRTGDHRTDHPGDAPERRSGNLDAGQHRTRSIATAGRFRETLQARMRSARHGVLMTQRDGGAPALRRRHNDKPGSGPSPLIRTKARTTTWVTTSAARGREGFKRLPGSPPQPGLQPACAQV